MNYLSTDKKLPGVAYAESQAELEAIAKDAVKRDMGDYFTSAQVKSLLASSRQRAFA